MLIWRVDEVFGKQLVGFGLEIEICQDPAMVRHFVVESKIDEANVLNKAIINDLPQTLTETVVDNFVAVAIFLLVSAFGAFCTLSA